MKKRSFLWSMLTMMMVGLLSVGFTSCHDDDDDIVPEPTPAPVVLDPADEVVGNFTGTLKPMGYSDEPARCYVKLTKLSSDAVRMENLICEEFDMDMNPANLRVKRESDGRITLSSETSKSVEGSYYYGQLTLSFSTAMATFYFSGKKNN